jgi:hypothetical protein
VIKKPLTKPTHNLYVGVLFSEKRSKLSVLTLVLILVLATLSLGASKAYATVDASARLLGNGGNSRPIVNTNSVANFSSCANSTGIRGITSDGTYVYYRPSGDSTIICKTTLTGTFVSANTVTNANSNSATVTFSNLSSEQRALTYANGCILFRDSYIANSKLMCVDTSNWTMYGPFTPTGQEIPLGGGWLSSNIMNFPDGRVGVVSAPNAGVGTGAACPTSPTTYCKYLRLYNVVRTGNSLTFTFDRDITLADTESGWPNDDHGMASDGTYLYQTRASNGYKVWQLSNTAASAIVFNGAGSGTCGAVSGTTGGMCNINTSAGWTTGDPNATFFGRSHATNQYIMGDYAGYSRFWTSNQVAPPAGLGTSITISSITKKLFVRGSTTATAIASSGSPTYSSSGACSVNSSSGVVTFSSTGSCTITASVGTSPNIKSASTTFEIVPNLTQYIISRTGLQPNSLSSFIPPPYITTERAENVYACLAIVGATGATVLASPNLNISLFILSSATMSAADSGKSYTITGTLPQVQAAISSLKINSTSGRIMAANSGSIYLRVRANLIADATTDTECLNIGNDGRIQLYQYTSDQIRRKNVPQRSGSTP